MNRYTAKKLSNRPVLSENTFLILLAILVGFGAALLGLAFRASIDLVNLLFFEKGKNILAFLGKYYVVILPAIGGMIVGPLIYFFAREAKGHGVPEVMTAMAIRGGRIRPRVVLIKSLASAFTIGSGGSAGSEGPIVQIGAGIGSTLGQFFHLSEERLKSLVSCGAAAGIATVFNAPIAGVFFALEVISGEFSASFFSIVVISAVTASVVARAVYWGNNPVFPVAGLSLASPHELIFYVLLGILAGLFAVLEIKATYKIEDLFDEWRGIPEYVKPAVGGLLVGIIGLAFPQVFGPGYESIEAALTGRLSLLLLVLLVFIKLLAVTLTLGSGGSGGVFAPSLFMGAMLGGALGTIVHGLFPGFTAVSGAYALVGMGAVFAGAAQAPITSIIMIFEMTNDYRIILPLMIACVISYVIASQLHPESIYTLKLLRRGIKFRHGRARTVLETITVGEVMHREVETVPANITVSELADLMRKSRHTGFPVLDGNQLVGMVTVFDIRRAMDKGINDEPVSKIMSTNLIVTYPEENLGEALKKFAVRGVGRLPVVKQDDPEHLVGIITRSDIIRAYNKGLLDFQEEAAVSEESTVQTFTDTPEPWGSSS
ncbi:chloride channel protein [Calderihabitans maritimus]|uniref:Chloride channel protein EriC n=1 Tax=Calderihabitans maritimus TaxID=1246530 RepID=A0A1Z5HQM6_9FIRM|nr:chloride channel protein [Calderihabitans maritimus]GAW91814.1 chloride channel protein EriC [Calderihabitans maritimus]